METYIFKAVASSSILIAFYYIFLSKEKSFQFNRFYLLFALLFSHIIPCISLKLAAKEELKTDFIFQNLPAEAIILSSKPAEAEVNWVMIFFSIYAVVVLFLLIKSILSILKIFSLKGEKKVYKHLQIKILENQIPPFSFLGRLYLGKNYFKNEILDERIFLHEKNHIEQKHSLDLILIEFLKIIFWFNPALYLYKKAIVANHEFLADEKVLSQNFEVKSYQKLILDEISTGQNLQFTNQFNFNNTKKRFIMMTKPTSRFNRIKKVFTLPIFALLAFLFIQKSYATESTSLNSTNLANVFKNFDVVNSINTDDAVLQFLSITDKYKSIIGNKDFEKFKTEIPRAEQVKLVELFQKIDARDYSKLPIMIFYNEINKQIPTQKQIINFKNEKYSLTIDNQMVNNNAIQNYKNTDFYSVYIVKVQPKNPDFGKYNYGVVLYTKEYAQKFNSEKHIAVSFKAEDEPVYNIMKYDTIRKTIAKEIPLQSKSQNTIDPSITPSQRVENEVDILPEFPGGIRAFRSEVEKSFNQKALDKINGTVRTEVSFVVDKDGKTVDFKASGDNEIFNNEAINAAKTVNENTIWKPAMKDGKPVRFRFKMPMAMQFGQ